MKRLVIFLLVCQAGRESHAQLPTLPLEQLTTKDGLPSNDVWCINKDKQGFLWVGTGRSVCRYDGYTFQSPDEQKVGYCSGVSTDTTGMLYASIASKGLCRIDPRTLRLTTVLKNNYADSDPTNDTHDRVVVDSYNQVWISDYTAVKRYDLNRKKRRLYTLTTAGNAHQDASFFEDSRRRFWIVSELGLYRYDRRRDQLVCLLGRESRRAATRKPVRLERASEDANGRIWVGAFDQGLLRFSPADSSFVFYTKGFENQNVICARASVDENGRSLLFVGTEKGLSLLYPDRNEVYHLPEFYNKGIHVRDLYDDTANGVLWIGTREGLYKYRYRNPGIHTVDIPAGAVRRPVEVSTMLQTPDGNYLLGLSHSGALAWQPATNRFRLWPYPVSAYTYQLRWVQNRPVAFTDKGLFVGDPATERFSVWSAAARLFTTAEFRDGLLDRHGRIWIASLTEGLKVLDPATGRACALWPDSVGQHFRQNKYMRGLVEGADGKIWIATCPNGLYYFDEAHARFVNILELPANKGNTLSGLCINAMHRADDGSILFATWGGVNKVSPAGRILAGFDFERDKLSDNYCTNIAEDQLGNLWFSTNEGLHIANPQTRQIRHLTTIEGLHSNYPVGFLKNRSNELLLGYINAVNVLDINGLIHTETVPRIAISSVEVKGRQIHQDLTHELVLQPDENAISLSFTTLNFEPASQNLYSYQLAGVDTAWVELGNQPTVFFSNLPANTYTLRVRSRNSFGLMSANPLSIRLTVRPYFTATWWFRTLVGLVIAGLIVGVMRWRVNTLAERNRLDLQVAEWRLKALQSQMNPHFLFNSLNSVQNYLLTNRGVEGARYLSKFSKLVRRIMENSNHQYLPFEQIIDTLRMYVEIESFRFNHEFRYAFEIEDNEALLETLLPPLLLQPYVENAIWHGLMPKEGDKNLRITARLEHNQIVCMIEDNGVGRRYAPRREGHVSRGQEMTKGIFESLRRKDNDARIELIDLLDTDNHPAGTRVCLKISL